MKTTERNQEILKSLSFIDDEEYTLTDEMKAAISERHEHYDDMCEHCGKTLAGHDHNDSVAATLIDAFDVIENNLSQREHVCLECLDAEMAEENSTTLVIV